MNMQILTTLSGKGLSKVGSGFIRIFLILPATLTNFFSTANIYPAASMYPSLVASIVLPPAILLKGISAGFDFEWFLWAGVNGLVFGTFMQWLGVVAYRVGFRWVPGLGALRRRLGISFNAKESLQKMGTVGHVLASFFSPSGSQGGQAVSGSAAGANETLLRGAGIVPANNLANHIRSMYNQEAHNLLVNLGGVPIPYADETKHWLLAGRTGSGKTQAYNRFIQAARARNNLAMIADAGGGFYSRFGQAQDHVLNPFDTRDAGWSVFLEIEATYDCQRLAKAAIPDPVGNSGKEWTGYAQSLFADVLLSLWQAGEHSVKRLLYYVQVASTEELAALLGDLPAAVLTRAGNEKMLSNTRSIAALSLSVWSQLPDTGTFSVRKWIRENADNGNAGWLFVTHRDDQMAMLRNLVACWFEIAIVETLSLSENDNRRMWFLLDEVDSLGKISSLRAGATKLRKYGGAIVAGIQAVSQLRDTYGKEEATTLLSCLSSKLVLAAGDADTAQYFQKDIGDQMVERVEQSRGTNQSSTVTGNMSSGKNSNENVRQTKQEAVMASELMKMPDLVGYLNLVNFPLAKIQLEYTKFPQINHAFVAK